MNLGWRVVPVSTYSNYRENLQNHRSSCVCPSVIPMKSQYVKTTIKAGQTFRILAVFEDDRSRNQKNSSAGQTDREKIRGRYVQILSETRQVRQAVDHSPQGGDGQQLETNT